MTFVFQDVSSFNSLHYAIGFSSDNLPSSGDSWVVGGNGAGECPTAGNHINTGESGLVTVGNTVTVPSGFTSGYVVVEGHTNNNNIGCGTTNNGLADAVTAVAVGACTPTPTPGGNGGSMIALRHIGGGDDDDTPTATPIPDMGGALLRYAVVGPNVSNGQQPINLFVYLKHPAMVSLTIYSLLGAEVYATSLQGNQGLNTLIWTVKNKAYQEVASGLYVYALRVDNGSIHEKKVGKIAIVH